MFHRACPEKPDVRFIEVDSRDPAKYEGSAVDWINARLLRAMAERLFPNAVTTFTSLEQFDPAKKHMSIMELCPNSVQTDGYLGDSCRA